MEETLDRLPPVGGVLLDIDGTLHEAGQPVRGAAGALAELKERLPLRLATNTSRMSRRAVAEKLRDLGFQVDERDVLTATVAAAHHLEKTGVTRIQLLAPESVRQDFPGFEITDSGPEAVVVGDLGPGFTFETLNAAFRSLLGGARLVAMHRNRYWLTEAGPTLDAGPFVAALEEAAGTAAELVGKPARPFFDLAAASLGLPANRIAVVGDDPEADIAGGRRAGLIVVQVRTGKSRAGRGRGRAPGLGAPAEPHAVIDSVRELPRLLAAAGP